MPCPTKAPKFGLKMNVVCLLDVKTKLLTIKIKRVMIHAQIIDTCGADGPRIVKAGSLEDMRKKLADYADMWEADRIAAHTVDHLQIRSRVAGYTANYVVVTAEDILGY